MLVTLVAIKILNDHFVEKSTLWKLIEKKARAYCQISMEITEQTLGVIL